MGADNADIFRKIVFGLPSLKTQITAIFLLSFVYTGIAYRAFQMFGPVDAGLSLTPIGFLIFLIPSLMAGEFFYRMLPPYPRNWSYFLALVNQLILFLYALVLSGANNAGNAWSLIWLTLITIYLANILVLIMSIGAEYYKRILGISMLQPVILVAVFHIFVGSVMNIATSSYIFSIAALLVAATFLILLLFTVDYLIKTNTSVSAYELTSGILQNKRSALDLGFESRPEVQTLQIDNGEKFTMVAPWVHPGPLGGLGGGKLSGTLIEELNREGSGFFLHVPCTHKEDLADTSDWKKIHSAITAPEKENRASKMFSKEYDNARFYGRRFNDKKLVFLESEGIDDYDIGVFMENIDKENVLLVDLHNHDIQNGPDKEVQYGTVEAENLKASFDDFLEELGEQDLHDYSAGFKVAESEQGLMAMCEKVDNQEVLLLGTDTNGVTPDLRDLRKSHLSEFDEVLLFSTDTHESVHEMSKMKNSDIDAMQDAVEDAVDSVKPASIGLGSRKSESLKLLKYDYNSLVFSFNIMIRLIFIALAIFYLFLVLWIF